METKTVRKGEILAKKGYENGFAGLEENSQYFVEIHLTDVFIPSIPCSDVTIRRTFDYVLDTETIDVLIDGQVNELAKDVGYDIFINDFILSKDIAKFCNGDKELEEQFALTTGAAEDSILPQYQRAAVVNYVQDNKLDIEAYQDYGQDPVSVTD